MYLARRTVQSYISMDRHKFVYTCMNIYLKIYLRMVLRAVIPNYLTLKP